MFLNSSEDIAHSLKTLAATLGFERCGIAKIAPISIQEQTKLSGWLAKGYQADMLYMARNQTLRHNPQLLFPNGKSIIVVALNYYPGETLPAHHPQISAYALGEDYHNIMQDKLKQLKQHLLQLAPQTSARTFTDTAPILERYWAVKAGIGFVGKNNQLIIPHKGSYYFLGSIICDLSLPTDTPIAAHCGNCTRCIDHCPTKALTAPYQLNSNRCISYLTIENKGEIATSLASLMGNRLYGCDECQKSCPHNRFATPNILPQLQPSPLLKTLSKEKLQTLTPEEFDLIFAQSPIKRAGYKGLMRNLQATAEQI